MKGRPLTFCAVTPRAIAVLTMAPVWLAAIWFGTVASSGAALAGQAKCKAEGAHAEMAFPLPHVKTAIAAKKLSILVVGTGSSQLVGSGQTAYPARLQAALTRQLPGVAVSVSTDVAQKRTPAAMVKTLPAALASAKPSLVLWQTATVDAIQAVDPDQFSQALEKGIRLARGEGADVIFINPQYSPRTEYVIALGTYVDNMRWAAVQQEVPVFDRFNIMKNWYESGTFDLYSATKKFDMAGLVHDCIGRLLADLVIEAAAPELVIKRDGPLKRDEPASPDPAAIEKGK